MAPPRARLATDSRRPFGLRNAFGFRFTRASFARECLAFSSAMLAVLPESMRAGHLDCSARRRTYLYRDAANLDHEPGHAKSVIAIRAIAATGHLIPLHKASPDVLPN